MSLCRYNTGTPMEARDTVRTESMPEAVVYSKGNLPNHHDVSTSLAFKRMSSLA